MPDRGAGLRTFRQSEQQRSSAFDTQTGASRRAVEDTISGGQKALNEATRAAVSAGMPEFNQALEGVRESAVRRGVGVGGLGTSYEGDLASAFERNIANAVSSQAMNLYGEQLQAREGLYDTDVSRAESSRNRTMDLLTGERDYETAQDNARRKRRSGFFGAIGTGLGALAGSFIPGVGTMLGAELGGQFGAAAGA